LNVPLKIEANIGDIINTYSADGVKLKSVDKTRSLTKLQDVTKEFHDGIEYLDSELEAIYHEQGRIAYYDELVVISEDESIRCMEAYNEFCLKDHLGNPRIRFADKNMDGRLEHNLQDSCKNEIFGTNHYYPFGMETEGPWYLQRTGVQNHYRYNGKEDIGSIGILDYGARYYSPEIGRFTSTDRFAEMYTSMTPYQYGANNPVKYIDINGDSLQVAFQNNDARQAFIDVANRGLEGQFQVNISASGTVTFDATDGGGDVSKLSKNGQAFYNSTSKVLNSKNIVSIKADFGNSSVHTGHFNSGTIDMADILQFNENPNQLGGTQLGKLTHEIVEQGEKQLHGSGFNSAHSDAIYAENKVNNSRRTDSNEWISGAAIQSYSRGDRTVDTKITFEKSGGWRNLWFPVNRRVIKVNNR